MDTLLTGLRASAPEALPFARALHARAFLLERPAGNVLIGRSDALRGQAAGVRAAGGVTRQYLGHWHEAAPVSGWAAEALGADLAVHEADAAEATRLAPVAQTFSGRHRVDGDLEVIPIPGHTPGSTAYLWDAPGHRVLFSADTVYVRDGEWVAAVLESSDRAAYLESLELLRGLEFDVLAPWAAGASDPPAVHTGRADARRRIGAIIARLRAGGSS